MRLACLYVPDFPLAAAIRSEPDLQDEAVAIIQGTESHTQIVAVSAAAARRGVTPGLSAAQGQAIFADLLFRHSSRDCRRAAHAALCDVAYSFSPRIEAAGDGVVYLDTMGSGALFDSELHLAQLLSVRAEQVGLSAHVGVAGSKIAAYLTACNGGGVTVIPTGEEWAYLAPLPVSLLTPSATLSATLTRWGIQRIGDLAALPVSAVGTRLGPEGLMLVRRARGEDEQPLTPRTPPLQFEESIELDYGIETLEPLTFVLRALLDRLTARLAVRGLVCGDLRLALGLASHGHDERTVAVAVPSNDSKALLTLTRLHLEAQPPPAPVEAVHISAVPERLRTLQLDLFRPNGPAPERLAVTLARLAALCGADRVGAPAVADSHRPETYSIRSFGANQGSGSRGQGSGTGDTASRSPSSSPCIALRAIRPPRLLEVHYDGGRIEFVRGDDMGGRVVSWAGPWRVSGEWWHETAYAHDYYDVQLSDGGVYRLYRDTTTQSWYVAGVYD